jgi:glycosyltransferase involved in cell wall biosynthesis
MKISSMANTMQAQRCPVLEGPLVSIGLPVYNSGAQLTDAIRALLVQIYLSFELIPSGSCSSDVTASICALKSRPSRLDSQ